MTHRDDTESGPWKRRVTRPIDFRRHGRVGGSTTLEPYDGGTILEAVREVVWPTKEQ